MEDRVIKHALRLDYLVKLPASVVICWILSNKIASGASHLFPVVHFLILSFILIIPYIFIIYFQKWGLILKSLLTIFIYEIVFWTFSGEPAYISSIKITLLNITSELLFYLITFRSNKLRLKTND